MGTGYHPMYNKPYCGEGPYEKLEVQCGLKAINVFLKMASFGLEGDIYGHKFYKKAMERLKMSSFLNKIPAPKKKALLEKDETDWKDIVEIMAIVAPDFSPDFRYNSIKRDTKGKIFFSNLKGIVALKFKDTNISHWAVFWEGIVVPLIPVKSSQLEQIERLEKMKVAVEEFDGFGHTIAFRSKDEVGMLKRYSNCTKNYCDQCVRKDFCSQIK